MAKPLRSADPNPKSVQFSQFGVLDDGKRSAGAIFSSLGVNVAMVLIVILISLVVKNSPVAVKQLTEITLPPPLPKPPPPPRNPPVMPPTPKVLPTPPKITVQPPVEKLPDIVKLTPAPVKPMPPTPEVKVLAPPAPKIVNLGNPKAASVPNNDPHPSAVSMGRTDSPVSPNGPPVSNISLGRGVPGMSGTGNGPHANKVTLGNGLPGGTNMSGSSANSVAGVRPVTGLGGTVPPPQANKPTTITSLTAAPPKLLYKPQPVYSAEAKAMHLEGNVRLKIRVESSGTIDVISVVQSLGHGLDEAAKTAILAAKFKPAVDATGKAIDWIGIVDVGFQLS